jgi:hypothetical protein
MKRITRNIIVCGIGLLSTHLLLGCSGGDDDGADAGVDGVNCDAIANVGAAISVAFEAGPPPEMTGGTVTDGTYVLTSEVFYNGETDDTTTSKRTLVIAKGTLKNAESEDGDADRIIAGTYSTSGTALTLSTVCPRATTLVFPYTATASTVALLTNDGSTDGNDLETYSKQ